MLRFTAAGKISVNPLRLPQLFRLPKTHTVPAITTGIFGIRSSIAHIQPTTPQSRSIHTQLPLSKKYDFGAPRFNRGPPSVSSLYWNLIPDGLKALFAIMGVSAFVLFVAGPILIIVVPPLVVGTFILRKIWTRRRENDMRSRWKSLLETSLTFKGSVLDQQGLEEFALKRVIDAVKLDENGISETLGIDLGEQYHPLESRLEFGAPESIDQDFRVSRSLGMREQITVISYGLYDTDDESKHSRIATVIVSLKPRTITSLVDLESTQDAVIEIRPNSPLRHAIVLNTESSFHEPPVITIRTKNPR